MMESVKTIFRTYPGFITRSRRVLLCTLAGSLVLNLVLFLKIPLHTKPEAGIHSQETVLFEAVPHSGEHHIVPMQSANTNATFKESATTKHQMYKTTQRFPTGPRTRQKTRRIRTSPPRQTTQELSPTQPQTATTTFPTPQKPKSACPRMSIHADKDTPHQDTVCRPHLPAEDACEYTAEIFKLEPSVVKCHDQKEPPYKLCSVSETRNGKRLSAPRVKCDISACLKTEDVTLHIVDPSDGNYLQLDLPGTTSNIEMTSVVIKAIEKTRTNGFNFLFIDCVGQKHQKKISQLLTFLPPENVFKSKGGDIQNKVNVNVVLLDSISRPHFYRSLRKTVAHLREKSADSSYKAHIFDFELFQSVHGHTHENEHALFGGTLYPENFTKAEKDDAPTNMEILFGVFKDAGYQTMAQNDMCWKAWYGFMTSFMTEEWPELQEKIKRVIDSTGITEASCKILQRYQRTTSFTDGEDHQICYNGKHQHRHLFEHLTKYLRAVTITSETKPLFSYTETNVAHDDVGIRVQTLDEDLIHLIDNVAQLPNTFTLLYADHGNTYTEYQVSMLEGRLEMYHPTLLGILPKELGEKFGKEVVENLRINQYRLLHLFDIRESLVELANYDARSRLNPVGIFREIPKNRTCDDLKLSTPNFCICEGWDSPVENSTAEVALAEFAIGQLNNQLQSSFLASHGDGVTNASPILFGACQRLQLQSITNARQRQTAKGTLVTTIDIKVQSGNIVDQEELITVQVESAQQLDSNSFDMRLVTFNRISHYSIYEQCADPGVPVHLCICNKRDTIAPAKRQNSTIYDIVGKNSELRKLKPCLLLIKRAFSENSGQDDFVGVEVYELANICTDKEFSVKLDAEMDNVRSSTELPIMVELKPRSIYFASVMMTEVGYVDAKLKLKLRIVTDDLQGDDAENGEKRSGREEGKENLGENDENGGKRSGRQEGDKKDNLDKKWRKTSSRTKKRGRKGEKWKPTIDINK